MYRTTACLAVDPGRPTLASKTKRRTLWRAGVLCFERSLAIAKLFRGECCRKPHPP